MSKHVGGLVKKIDDEEITTEKVGKWLFDLICKLPYTTVCNNQYNIQSNTYGCHPVLNTLRNIREIIRSHFNFCYVVYIVQNQHEIL